MGAGLHAFDGLLGVSLKGKLRLQGCIRKTGSTRHRAVSFLGS